MAKPMVHAKSSAKQWGGNPEDYFEVHDFMDRSKGAIADNRHRALTHTSWFISNILERVKFTNSCEPTPDNKFPTITNSNGRCVSVRAIGEQHILEDFKMKFIPTAQDFLQEMNMQMWMNNAMYGVPASSKRLYERKHSRKGDSRESLRRTENRD